MPIGQIDGLFQSWVMKHDGDVDNSRSGGVGLHLATRLSVEGAERLVHQENAAPVARARAIATRCFMPPDS